MINYEFVIDIGPNKETIKEVVRQIKEKDMIKKQ